MTRRQLAFGLGVSALLVSGRGLWIPAKAVLAQALLERAWNQSAGTSRVRPWVGADSWPVARLRAPRLGVDLIVLANATGSTLAFAPGHVDGTAAPGAHGNTVLAGHRDTHFAFLERLRPGDELQLERPGGPEARYLVRSARIVDRARSEILAPAERDLLTLVTCWPFAAMAPGGRERYVVQAERI